MGYSAHSNPKETTMLVTLCVPTQLATNVYIGAHRPLAGTSWNLKGLLNIKNMGRPANEDETLLITAPFIHAGPVWNISRQLLRWRSLEIYARRAVNFHWSLIWYIMVEYYIFADVSLQNRSIRTK
ncbi:hypothetical protein GGI42DRAFT_256065 [Trichoderma sp. SZMC 28013]